MMVQSVQPVAGLYLHRGLKQLYSRREDYLSFSQVLRRLRANTADEDAYWAVHNKIREYAVKDGRKVEMEHQAFQIVASHLPNVVEIRCFDLRSDRPIHATPAPYIIVRVMMRYDVMLSVKDVVK